MGLNVKWAIFHKNTDVTITPQVKKHDLRMIPVKSCGVSKWDKLHLDHYDTLGVHHSKSKIVFSVQNFGGSSQYQVG